MVQITLKSQVLFRESYYEICYLLIYIYYWFFYFA